MYENCTLTLDSDRLVLDVGKRPLFGCFRTAGKLWYVQIILVYIVKPNVIQLNRVYGKIMDSQEGIIGRSWLPLVMHHTTT